MDDVMITGMTHEIMKEKILKAVGGRPPMSMRDTWAEFIKTKWTKFFIRDEWVKNKKFWDWLFDQPAFEFTCRDDGVGIELMYFGNGPYAQKEAQERDRPTV